MVNPNRKQAIARARDEWFVWLLTVELAAHIGVTGPVARLYQERLAGREPTQEQWQGARSAAYAAAYAAAHAAYAAAHAAHAAYAAYDAAYAAYAAAHAAADAADAAADAAADDADAKDRVAKAYGTCLARNGIPIVEPRLHAAVATAVCKAPDALDMSTWHCGTSHCRAGWAVVVCDARDLEESVGTDLAARAIYLATYPDEPAPNFFATDEEALADIKRCAGVAT